MRTILINPPPYKIQEPFYDTPLFPRTTLAFLAAHLRRAGKDVHVIDCKFDRLGHDETIKMIKELNPGIVGFTSFTNEITQAAKLAGLVKKLNKEIYTVIGGVHCTTLPEHTLREFPQFDYGVMGEGEDSLLELVSSLEKKLPTDKIPGVCQISIDGGFNKPLDRSFIDNADSLATPAWDLFKPAKEYYLQTSRGCPFHCPFCVNPNGRKIRARSVGKVLDEIEILTTNYGNLTIRVGDEIFTLDRDRAIKICEGLIERNLDKKIQWWCATHVRFIDYELAGLMKRAGCFTVGLGIETGNEERLKSISKGTSCEMISQAVSAMKKADLEFEAFFILGQPDETAQTVKELINFAIKINPPKPVFGIMVPYPGTKIWEMALEGEGGYILESKNWNDYNKQLGNALSFKYISRKSLERYQISGYIKVFLYNRRIWDLVRFIWEYKTVGLSIVKKMAVQMIRK